MSERLQERMKEYTYQRPSDEILKKMAYVRQMFQDTCKFLDDILPECRNKSLAFTALEDCSTRAMKALNHTDPESKQVSP